MGILEKIADIEHEISRTQKNKGILLLISATEYHLGILKAKLAKYRHELIEPKGGGGSKGEGFDVMRSGDARVALIGFPSVGKSTLLTKLTTTESVAAAYEFTTLTCIPGKIYHNGAAIQLLDLPGIIEGAAQGKGRGRQVIAVARSADLILMMLDAGKGDLQRKLLERELETMGIRLNQTRPDVFFNLKSAGGISFNATVKLTHISEKLAYHVLHEYKIHHCELVIRQDITVDELIDIINGNRKYIRCLYCYNKIDQATMEEIDWLARRPHSCVVSCELDLNLDYLVEKIWDNLGLIRIYTKKRGEYPDFNQGLILQRGISVEEACDSLHNQLKKSFKFALVWGKSAKHVPQKAGLTHLLEDEDVIQIFRKIK